MTAQPPERPESGTVELLLNESADFADANAKACTLESDAMAWRAHARKVREAITALRVRAQLMSNSGAHLQPRGELVQTDATQPTGSPNLRASLIEECARIVEAWEKPSFALMRAGEMTAQELRTVIAVAGNIATSIRGLSVPSTNSKPPPTECGSGK